MTEPKKPTPKQTAWVYLIVGIIGVPLASWFLYLDLTGQRDSGLQIFDWVIIAMSVVALGRGIAGLRQL